jgi:hypothetical protein
LAFGVEFHREVRVITPADLLDESAGGGFFTNRR